MAGIFDNNFSIPEAVAFALTQLCLTAQGKNLVAGEKQGGASKKEILETYKECLAIVKPEENAKEKERNLKTV